LFLLSGLSKYSRIATEQHPTLSEKYLLFFEKKSYCEKDPIGGAAGAGDQAAHGRKRKKKVDRLRVLLYIFLA